MSRVVCKPWPTNCISFKIGDVCFAFCENCQQKQTRTCFVLVSFSLFFVLLQLILFLNSFFFFLLHHILVLLVLVLLFFLFWHSCISYSPSYSCTSCSCSPIGSVQQTQGLGCQSSVKVPLRDRSIFWRLLSCGAFNDKSSRPLPAEGSPTLTVDITRSLLFSSFLENCICTNEEQPNWGGGGGGRSIAKDIKK